MPTICNVVNISPKTINPKIAAKNGAESSRPET